MNPQPSSSRSRPSRTQSFSYESHGITVKYPHDPYESQKQMTDTLLEAVLNGQNCLLESPTGTGKTLAILCTLLAHREHEIANGRTPRTFYYASHTIPQLSQAKRQLSTTSYANIRAAITASRKYLCINEEAQQSPASLDDACQMRRDNCRNPRSTMDHRGQYPTCEFFQNIRGQDGRTQFVQEFQQSRGDEPLWDIEDIVRFGKDHSKCPYYGARAMAQQADLILCPYNYLLHSFQRDAMGFNIKDSIIVFDEAHHVEDTCMEIGSTKISRERLRDIILPALDAAMGRNDVPERKREPLRNLAVAFHQLADWLNRLSSEINTRFEQLGDKRVYKIRNPLEAFQRIGYGPDEVAELYKDSLKVDDKYWGWDFDLEAVRFKIPHTAMSAIHSITWVLKVLFTGLSEDAVEDNRESYSVDAVTDLMTLELCVTCLNPAVVFKCMTDAYAVILTSGTLAPLEPYSAELGIPFPHKLIAAHGVDPSNVFAGVIAKYRANNGGTAIELNFKSETLARNSEFERQANAAAMALKDIFRNCPGGIIVYMSSKSNIQRFKHFWAGKGMLSWMVGPMWQDSVFFESDFTDQEYEEKLQRFCERAENGPNGAVMFAVFRGRASEGADFKDDKVRAVVLMGIPYPPFAELKVVRKKEYHNRLNHANPEIMDGWAWYERMAFRVMNQAVGRCIRHADDWGAIIFLDGRMKERRVHLPQWVKDSWKGTGSVETMIDKLKRFLDSDEVGSSDSAGSDAGSSSGGESESGSGEEESNGGSSADDDGTATGSNDEVAHSDDEGDEN